jgi:hypothetical protein
VPAGIAVGSVGLAVLAAGGILGLVAKSKHGGSEDYCLDDTDICSDDGIAIRSDARAMGTGATILLAVGAAGAVAGAVMWIAAPSTETPGGTEAAYVALLPAGPGAQLITGGCW